MPRYRLLAGGHSGQDFERSRPDASGRYPIRAFKVGETFISESKMVAGDPAKFELLDASVHPPKQKPKAPPTPAAAPAVLPAKADLEGLTVKELHQLADSEGIELKGAHTKAEIIKAIEAKR